MNLQNNKLKNFTPLPNEIFSLHLSTGELATYAVPVSYTHLTLPTKLEV